MLVHGCAWNLIGEKLYTIIKDSNFGQEIINRINASYARPGDRAKAIGQRFSNIVSNWIGYGSPNIDRVLDCTEQRASLLGFGELSDGEANIFRIPLPPSLASKPEKRRLTVTLAWLSPIAKSTQKYRVAHLWFERNNKPIVPSRCDVNWQAVKRGTIQHEVFEGERAEPFVDGDNIEIKVNCRNDAGVIGNPIPYGLVVSLEVAEGVDMPIYDEIRARIAPLIQIQQAAE